MVCSSPVFAVLATVLISGPKSTRTAAPPPAVTEKPVAETIRTIRGETAPNSEDKPQPSKRIRILRRRQRRSYLPGPPAVDGPGQGGVEGEMTKKVVHVAVYYWGGPDWDKSNNKRPRKRAD